MQLTLIVSRGHVNPTVHGNWRPGVDNADCIMCGVEPYLLDSHQSIIKIHAKRLRFHNAVYPAAQDSKGYSHPDHKRRRSCYIPWTTTACRKRPGYFD